MHLLAVPNPIPLAPPRKQWYDKLADALLGDDEHEIGSPSSRYALICERCFTHNGLVKESMWEDARESSDSVQVTINTKRYLEQSLSAGIQVVITSTVRLVRNETRQALMFPLISTLHPPVIRIDAHLRLRPHLLPSNVHHPHPTTRPPIARTLMRLRSIRLTPE